MKLVQVQFSQPFPPPTRGIKLQLAWVEEHWKLKKGDVISFEDDESKWKVEKVYSQVEDLANIKTKWGLNLPKSQRTER
jgi:hypothetical protein